VRFGLRNGFLAAREKCTGRHSHELESRTLSALDCSLCRLACAGRYGRGNNLDKRRACAVIRGHRLTLRHGLSSRRRIEAWPVVRRAARSRCGSYTGRPLRRYARRPSASAVDSRLVMLVDSTGLSRKPGKPRYDVDKRRSEPLRARGRGDRGRICSGPWCWHIGWRRPHRTPIYAGMSRTTSVSLPELIS
jgi:hypothetical protein